jgi:AraC-like DNA-binding protein
VLDLFPWIATYLFLPLYAFNYFNEQQAYGLIHFLDQYNTYVDIPRYFSMLIYTCMSWKLLLSYQNLKNKAFRWARFMVIGFSMIMACWTPFLCLYISPLQDFLLQKVYYYPLYYPIVGFIYWISIQQMHKGIFGNSQKGNYLDAENITSCIEKMRQVMHLKELYLNPELRLEHFCQEVEVPPKIVSQILNHHLHKGFNDFVNEFRIEEAKARLVDKIYQHLTLEGIALEVGFASRTTFLRAFKKVTGMSPNYYKQKLDANPDLPPA